MIARLAVMVIACLLGAVATLSFAEEEPAPVLPQYDQYKHMGVATCASSNCHARNSLQADSNVNQSEYRTWLFHDRHAKAYRTLQNDQSKKIGTKLGIDKPWESAVCLDCHADNVPVERRGLEFQISDGVACEACHGGSEKWLSRHTLQPYDAIRNETDGMYPGSNLSNRTKLCGSCHIGTTIGTGQKLANHNIMAAGHPRLGFELDTFTWREPAHHQVDADYIERKHKETSIERALIGTAVSAQLMASNLTTLLSDNTHAYPELALFDCHSCHHSLNDVRWQPRKVALGLKPGTVRLNDGLFMVLAALVGAVDTNLEKTIRDNIRTLHFASQKSASEVRVAAELLQTHSKQAQVLFEQATIDVDTIQNMLRQIITLGSEGGLQDYITAEHAVMCMDSLAQQLGEKPELAQLLDRAFAILVDDDLYLEGQLRQVMRQYLVNQ